MHLSTRISLAAVLACLFLSMLASSALAVGPAVVTVRAEGLGETKLPPTVVTTSTEPVVKDGIASDSCSGTSAIGALERATGGSWGGPWESSFHQYVINTIDGETHQFEAGASSNYYWSFWRNDTYQESGACEVQLNPGDRVLFFPICYEGCPAGPEPTPLEVEAPTSVNVGEPITVTVRQYNAKGEASPALGANVTSAGTSASTEALGRATLSLGAAGTHELQVSGASTGPPAVRTEATVCVHDGNDGNCGTSVPTGGAPPTTHAPRVAAPYTGPYALVAQLTGLHDGHVYGRAHAPRVLAGTILAHSAVNSVALSLRRSYRGRCTAYDGTRERFLVARCGQESYFAVSSNGVFSYLLPAALPPGRYVLDVRAKDAAGNSLTLARGTSRIVFRVR
jgi:hypothetical protein